MTFNTTDILLNFRTTFVNEKGEVVSNTREIAVNISIRISVNIIIFIIIINKRGDVVSSTCEIALNVCR